MGTWIDFKEIREKIDFAAVLQYYGVALRIRRGNQHHGFCPLPTHRQHGGKKRSPSFSANLQRKCFHCFSCQAAGNCIDFCCFMEGMNPDNPADVRKAALLLHERFLGGKADNEPRRRPPAAKPPAVETPKTADRDANLPRIVNAPLDFELKGLDPSHPYLAGRGFSPETIAHFGLGYCAKGLMKDRIAIPLHDQQGRLIGYAGRLVDDDAVGDEHPKYLLPGSRKREGKLYQFEKSRFLYNGHRIEKPVRDLIVVEGFPSVWWLWQHGLPNTVAVMGADCSQEQAAIVAKLTATDGTVWIVSDGDDAGERCAAHALPLLARHRRVRWMNLPAGKQPTDYSAEELRDLLPP